MFIPRMHIGHTLQIVAAILLLSGCSTGMGRMPVEPPFDFGTSTSCQQLTAYDNQYVEDLVLALSFRSGANRSALYVGGTATKVGSISSAGWALVSTPSAGQLGILAIAQHLFLSLFQDFHNDQLALNEVSTVNKLLEARQAAVDVAEDLTKDGTDTCRVAYVGYRKEINVIMANFRLTQVSSAVAAFQAALAEHQKNQEAVRELQNEQ